MNENVLRGIQLLDEKVPDWRQRIDKEALSMQWCSKCIIGQVFSKTYDYEEGLERLGIDDNEAYYYGFEKELDTTWDELTQLWTEALGEQS